MSMEMKLMKRSSSSQHGYGTIRTATQKKTTEKDDKRRQHKKTTKEDMTKDDNKNDGR